MKKRAIVVRKMRVTKIWIEEEYRCKDYGTMILNHVEGIARVTCHEKMWVNAVKTDAEPMFRKNGYILKQVKNTTSTKDINR